MPEEGKGPGSGSNRIWHEFDSRAFLLHYAHVSDGFLAKEGCGVCREGVSGMVRIHEEVVPEPDVVQGGGVDEEKTSPPASGGGWYYKERE